MIQRGVSIWREEGSVSLFRRSLGFLSWRVLRSVSANVTLPAPVLYRWFEVQAKVDPMMSDANPMEPIRVDPERIRYYHSGGPRRFGRVASGDWDTPSERFEENIVARSVIAHFSQGVDWQETALYREYRSRMEENGGSYYGRRFDSTDELDAYFESIEDLYDSISSEGYLTQRELLRRGGGAEDPSDDHYHPYLNEVTVNIYRDGELAKRKSGNHRLAIAKGTPRR